MANYVVGDIQGCFYELSGLLAEIGFNPGVDRIFLLGDLVNRGPDSLQVLRWAYQHRSCCQIVLGNHDLHLLSVFFGARQGHSTDTLDAILQASDADLLLNWLRCQPLILLKEFGVLVHAGVWPGWSLEEALEMNAFCQSRLGGENLISWLSAMYGQLPLHFADARSELELFRFAINAFTRMRFIDSDLRLNLSFKGELERAPDTVLPWFAIEERPNIPRIYFGHWSALGLRVDSKMAALDTGCIWGGQLTAYCIETGKITSFASSQPLYLHGD